MTGLVNDWLVGCMGQILQGVWIEVGSDKELTEVSEKLL